MKRVTHLFFFFLSVTIQAQKIDSTLAKYAKDFGQEKAYLHYDKSSYAPGETIWYKAYLMQGLFPASSKSFYIDILNDSGRMISHSMIPVEFSTASGQFDIPETYSGKFIHVNAYTKWMLNFDSAFLYNKDIRIVSKDTSRGYSQRKVISSIHFFPEGGDMVEGVSNKIAFKANDQWGEPVNVKGMIQNNQGDAIATLQTIHDGMGYFYVLPKAGETFTAKWFDENGTAHNTDLPVAKKTGVSLQVAIASDKINFLISVAPQFSSSFGAVHLLGTMNQHKVFELTKDFSAGNISGVIPIGQLPSGILTITVFDSNWKPLAERITFVNNKEYLFDADMLIEKSAFDKRGKNEILLNVPDSLPATFSVSITDLNIDDDRSNNIISHLILTGDLKGNVYKPSYYFSNNSDSISKQIDLVMLTHGWRRFKWDDMMAGKFREIIYPKDTSYLSILGKINGVASSRLKDSANIILMFKRNGRKKTFITPINLLGEFSDPTALLFDTTVLFYELPKSKGFGSASVTFNHDRLPAISHSAVPYETESFERRDTTGHSHHLQLATEALQLSDASHAKVLKTVSVKARQKTEIEMMDKKYTRGLFSGGDAYQLDLLDDAHAMNSGDIFRYLSGKVPGLEIRPGNPPFAKYHGSMPNFYIDEIRAPDLNMVASLNAADVAYIKVMRSSNLWGSGAIAIYTRQGGDQTANMEGLHSESILGYDSMRDFYVPDYSTDSANNDANDLRTTLYWNPQVITTNENNQATITFFNNDVSKAFRVVIEGMTGNGRLVHLEKIMK